jgi:DNA polymerase-3 subunit beta
MIPVLTNFQFQVSENQLKVVASSLEMSVEVSTDQVQTKVAGVDVLPARTLLNIVKESSAGSNVFVEVTASGAVIVSGGFSAEIKMMSGDNYPVTDNLDDVVFYEVERTKFIEAVTSVKYALPGKESSGQDALRMISIKSGKFTACDGARFQQVRIEGFKLNMKLPTFSIATLIKVLNTRDIEMIEIGETTNKLVFRLGNTVFRLNKLDKPYPNVEQLWLRPALSNDQLLIVDRAELVTGIKQVKIAADSNTIALIISDNTLKLQAKDGVNTASTVIGCTWVGKPRAIVVNLLHLAEMLKAYSQPECRFLLGEDTKTYKPPILLKDDDTNAIATVAQQVTFRADLTT